MQTLKRSEATDGDRDPGRHAMPDSRVEKDSAAGHLSDIDQPGPFTASAAPTEPQVTNVTSASTARVAVGDDERIPVGMLGEPAPCSIVELDSELVHHEIMALPAWLGGRDVLVVAENVLRVVLRLQRPQPPVLLAPIGTLDLFGTGVVAEVVHVGRAAA